MKKYKTCLISLICSALFLAGEIPPVHTQDIAPATFYGNKILHLS